MTLARLALKDLGRSPLRTALTVLAATVGTLAFVFLQTVIDLWYTGVASAQADRLNVRNKTSITQPLPLAYLRRIASIPGVSEVTYGSWFGGMKGESRKDFFPNFTVDQATYLKVYDEMILPEEQARAWVADPCGAVVGPGLVERFGWEVGDRVALEGTIYPGTWELTVRGVYRGRTADVDDRLMLFGHRCVNERLPEEERDQTGYFAVRIDDPSRGAQVAAAIDAMFANSAAETRTESERAFRLGFVAMSGAILTAIRIVSYVILVIMLLVVSNTIAMGVRDKAVDMATMRALGFKARHVIGLVLVESATIGVLSAALGILGAPVIVRGFSRVVAVTFGSLPAATIQPGTLALGAAASLLVGVAAGVIPALRAARLPVAEGLRRVA